MTVNLSNSERLMRLETKLDSIIDEQRQQHSLIREHIVKHEEFHTRTQQELDRRFRGLDEKYASKNIERASYWFLGVVGTSLLGALMYILLG